ncbi:hypothetical protein LEMLEM_LOCUS9001, partial [Lemmus lemmus]
LNFAPVGKSISSLAEGYCYGIPAHTEEQLRHPALGTAQLLWLDSWTFR